MSRQLSVWSFFRKPSDCDVVDKRGENRRMDEVEDEHTEDIYQPAAADVTEKGGSDEVKLLHGATWKVSLLIFSLHAFRNASSASSVCHELFLKLNLNSFYLNSGNSLQHLSNGAFHTEQVWTVRCEITDISHQEQALGDTGKEKLPFRRWKPQGGIS